MVDLQTLTAPSTSQASFQLPHHPAWLHGQQLSIVVTNGSGTGSGFTTGVDRTAVITGASVAVVLSGGPNPITIEGRNLDRVQAGYIDAASPNVPPSPRFVATPGSMGLSVKMGVPAGCSRHGSLKLEEIGDGTTATGTHLIAGPNGRYGFPPVVTSVVPQVGAPGTTIHVYGQGLSWVTVRNPVASGSVSYTSVSYALVSDNELTLKIPNLTPPPTGVARTSTPLYGAQPFQPRLQNPFSPGHVGPQLSLVAAYPPQVNGLSAPYAEPGQPLTITGLGLADPALQPVVTVGTVPAAITSGTATAITVTMPALDANAYPNAVVPVTVQHQGGNSTAPTQLIIVDGPFTITSISPATVPAGVSTVVTVQGDNLARAKGICLPGASQAMLGRIDPVTSNYQLMVTVRSSTLNGPVSVAVPLSPAQPQTLVCQANPTAVTLTVQ